MHLIFHTLTAIGVLTAAASDFPDSTQLFPDVTPSLLYDDVDATKLLDYSDDSKSNLFASNDGLGVDLFADNECLPPGSGPLGRKRRREASCLVHQNALPRLQLPTTLDDLVEDGGLSNLHEEAVQDSLDNQEICPTLVYLHRNIPVCSSRILSNRQYHWGQNSYTLEYCSLFVPALGGCFWADQDSSLYCCSKYEVRSGVGHAEGCFDAIALRIMRGYQSLP